MTICKRKEKETFKISNTFPSLCNCVKWFTLSLKLANRLIQLYSTSQLAASYYHVLKDTFQNTSLLNGCMLSFKDFQDACVGKCGLSYSSALEMILFLFLKHLSKVSFIACLRKPLADRIVSICSTPVRILHLHR